LSSGGRGKAKGKTKNNIIIQVLRTIPTISEEGKNPCSIEA
jgi:hypothetical protein